MGLRARGSVEPSDWRTALFLGTVLFLSSGDALQKCYSCMSQLMKYQEIDAMTNGGPQHHSDPKKPKSKDKNKPEASQKPKDG